MHLTRFNTLTQWHTSQLLCVTAPRRYLISPHLEKLSAAWFDCVEASFPCLSIYYQIQGAPCNSCKGTANASLFTAILTIETPLAKDHIAGQGSCRSHMLPESHQPLVLIDQVGCSPRQVKKNLSKQLLSGQCSCVLGLPFHIDQGEAAAPLLSSPLGKPLKDLVMVARRLKLEGLTCAGSSRPGARYLMYSRLSHSQSFKVSGQMLSTCRSRSVCRVR